MRRAQLLVVGLGWEGDAERHGSGPLADSPRVTISSRGFHDGNIVPTRLGLRIALRHNRQQFGGSIQTSDQDVCLCNLQKSLGGWRELQSDLAFAAPQKHEMEQVGGALASMSKR